MTDFKTKLSITMSVASVLALAGCGQSNDDWTGNQYASRDTAICTDQAGRRVPDQNCQRYHGGRPNAFLWYYLGRNSAVPYYGERAVGGGYARAAGRSYFRAPASTSMARSAAISRGGFGSSAHGFGAGE